MHRQGRRPGSPIKGSQLRDSAGFSPDFAATAAYAGEANPNPVLGPARRVDRVTSTSASWVRHWGVLSGEGEAEAVESGDVGDRHPMVIAEAKR